MSPALAHKPYSASDRLKLRHALRYAGASLLLVAALVAYCELGSVLRGLPPAGLRSSAPWALQVAIPWIVIGAVAGALSGRIAGSRAAVIRSALRIGVAVTGIAAFALLGEALLRAVAGTSDLFAFLCERAPASIAASALVVAIYVGSRSRQQGPAPAHPTAPVALERSSAAPSPATAAAGEWLEVMTGTGRTTLRLGEIECLEADRNYLNVIHSSGRTYLLRQTMAAAASALDGAAFMRIHRSTIVNCSMIKEQRPGGVLVLRSGRTVTIGRAFRARVAQRLAHLRQSR